jgi:Na+/H+-dicarboxylate symporter
VPLREATLLLPASMSSEPRGRFPFVAQLLAAVVGGAALGLAFGPRVAFLGEIGVLIVRLLKALATPLVFFAVTESCATAVIPPKKGLKLVALCLFNAAVAGALAVTMALVVRPGEHFDATALLESAGPKPEVPNASLSPLATLGQLVPTSLATLFVENNVLALVVLALLFGTALRKLRSEGSGETLMAAVHEGFRLLVIVLGWVVKVVPLAVFGVLAKVVGTTGFSVFASLGLLVLTVSAGLLLHVFVYYAVILRLGSGRKPGAFFRAGTPALLTALTTGSSMATLPVTLKTLELRIGVSQESARLAAIVGTNFNNDGIMLYEVVAAIFVAQASGIALSPASLVGLGATSALAAAGIAGVPEAGLITLALVLAAARLPITLLPVLLTVDWFLGRLRAATNVASDMTIATVLDGRRTN